MLDLLYTLFIAPIEFWMEKTLQWGFDHTQSWGWAIIIMSIVVNTVILPIYLKAEHWQEEERSIRKGFEEDEAMIKRTFKGQERFAMITTMHRQAGYSPLLTLRSSIGFFLQIPFFFAAYHFLSHFEPLQGISFLGLTDLSKPDELFTIGGFAINVMPILMTVINIGSALIYTQNLSKRDKYQLYGMAAIFLVLLYNAAAGLVLYWTFNNIFSLIKNLILKYFNFNLDIRLPKIRNDISWTLPLAIVAPCLFLWSNNITYYPAESLFFSVITIISFAFVCHFLLEKVLSSNDEIKLNRSLSLLLICLYGIIVGLTICILGASVIKAYFYPIRWHFSYILPLFFIFIFLMRGYKVVNIILLIQLILSIGITCYNFGYEFKLNQIQKASYTDNEQVKLNKKPNVYYFLCESYQDLNDIRQIYGYDSSEFLQSLNQMGFLTKDAYSNSDFTLGSLVNLFTMDLRIGAFGNLDVSTLERRILGGSRGNRLFKIFKDNGYVTNFFVAGSNYFFFQKGELLDNTDASLNWKRTLFQPILDTNAQIRSRLEPWFLSKHTNQETDPVLILNEFLGKHSGNSQPQLAVFYLNIAKHTPSDNTYDYKMKEQWVSSNVYKECIKSGNQTLLHIAKTIKNKDPNSVIIFMGDHGPTRIRSFPYNFINLNDNSKKLHEIGETPQSLIDDHYHVFFSIHLPDSMIVNLQDVSHATLFHRIINGLSKNKMRAETYEKDLSVLVIGESTYVMAKKGVANDKNLFWGMLDKNKNMIKDVSSP